MSSNISKICNQQSIELNTDKLSNQNILENRGSKTSISDNIHQAKSLSSAQQNALNYIGKVLEKTYHLNSSDITNIKTFVSALDKQINEQIKRQSVSEKTESLGSKGAGVVEEGKAELKSSERFQKNIDASLSAKTSFFTQLKFLCAKIASFFGNNSKLEKLQEKGLEQFNELRGLLTKNLHGKNFLISFLEGNSSNQKAMIGMFKCLLGISVETKQDDDLKNNINGLKDILKSNKCQEILNFINESRDLSLDKVSIKFQQMLISELEKLTLTECKDPNVKNTVKALSYGVNFCTLNEKGLGKNDVGFYGGALAQLAGHFNGLLDRLAKHPEEEQQIFSEMQLSINNTKVKYKLKSCIKDKYLKDQTIDGFVAAARESLGDEAFLSQFKSEILDGSLKIRDKNLLLNDSFVKSIDVNNKKEVEGFSKAFYWADTNDVKASLKSSLSLSNSKILKATECSKEAVVFKDIERGYSYTFNIGGKKIIALNEDHQSGNKFEDFQNGLKNLPEEQQEKIKEFCANFASQGCFACSIPIAGDGCPTFEVNFDKNDTIVKCKTEGENSNWGNSGAVLARENFSVWEKANQYKPALEVSCEFSFTYKEGIVACKGKASDISVQKYEQNITFAE